MSVAVITGSSGLVGSEAARFFHEKGLSVVGIDNNMRQYFFGASGSTDWNADGLKRTLRNYTHFPTDVRDQEGILKIFQTYARDISLVIHAAAQPSHDWAAREPFTDFTVNANGTLVLLETTRRLCPDAPFVFTSTNKVYGDTPNRLPLIEQETRWEIDRSHPYFAHGIDETMAIDRSRHSLFGASKTAADILTQEYGLYFGLKTVAFRGGCITGPAHAGTESHGFLAYLVRCAVTGRPYTVYGYGGKQVRDNIHSYDLVSAFWQFFRRPRPGAVYNLGGSRGNSCSVLEAIRLAEEISGKKMAYTISGNARPGDHLWWISDVRGFRRDYPDWDCRYGLRTVVEEIVDAVQKRTRGQPG